MPLKKSLDDIKSAIVKYGWDKLDLEGKSTKELVDLYNKTVVPKPQRIPRHNREGKRLRETLKRVYPDVENGSSSSGVEVSDSSTPAKMSRLSITSISSPTPNSSNNTMDSSSPTPTKRKPIVFNNDDASSPQTDSVKKKFAKITFA